MIPSKKFWLVSKIEKFFKGLMPRKKEQSDLSYFIIFRDVNQLYMEGFTGSPEQKTKFVEWYKKEFFPRWVLYETSIPDLTMEIEAQGYVFQV